MDDRTLLEMAARSAGDREARRFFSFSQDEDFEEHDTAEAAEHAAQESIDFYRDLAPDGWPEAVEYVRWGVVLGMAVQKPKDKGLVDYELQRLPALAQPAAPVAQERSHRAEVSDDALRQGLRTIIEYPVTHTDNMDAMNIKNIALDTLSRAALEQKT